MRSLCSALFIGLPPLTQHPGVGVRLQAQLTGIELQRPRHFGLDSTLPLKFPADMGMRIALWTPWNGGRR